VCVGGTATVDGGRGLRRVVGTALDKYDVQVACDVTNPLLGANGAARVYGPQKGASAQTVDELETLLAEDPVLRPYAGLPGAGSGGGLGAALAALGGRLVAGANLVLDLPGLREEHLLGRRLAIGSAVLRVLRRPGHCLGVYADVERPGVITTDDEVRDA